MIYGIDLGTTYSAIAYVDDTGKAQIIRNGNYDTTPSVVYFEGKNEEGKAQISVGHAAKEMALIHPERVVSLVKREMGEEWTFEIEDEVYTPVTMSAIIIRELLRAAAENGHEVKDAVITCPAYFNASAMEATRQAGIAAGLNVLNVISEPVAAALSYGMALVNDDINKHVVIYDLGGGTFDVTVIRLTKDACTVLCTEGNHRLGGADWDACLESIVIDKFMQNCPDVGDPREDPDTYTELKVRIEKLKFDLSSKNKGYCNISLKGEKARLEVTREEFERETEALLMQTKDYFDKALNFVREKHDVQKIDEILLVGGSSLMPQVWNLIESNYGVPSGIPFKLYEPNRAVALGAALYGVNAIYIQQQQNIEAGGENANTGDGEKEPIIDIFPPDTRPINITTVASKSYGVVARHTATNKLVVNNLIIKQTPVPCSVQRVYPIKEEGATSLPITIYCNNVESNLAPNIDDYELVGEAVLELPAGLPQSAPIEVSFTIDKEGQLLVSARELIHNTEVRAEFNVKGGLTEQEIEEAIQKIGELEFID